MARLFKDSAAAIKGIGVQEETAVAIDESGAGKVFGYGAAFFLMHKQILAYRKHVKNKRRLHGIKMNKL